MATPRTAPTVRNPRPVEKASGAIKSEADVISRAADSRGVNKGGRKPAADPVVNIGVSLLVRHNEALNKLAALRFGKNRSLALNAVLDGTANLNEVK
jgi:hypothetical protein